MKIAILITRILLGLVFFVFGLNQFFHFIPMPPPPAEGPVHDFMIGIMGTKYFIPLLGTFQTISGLTLLTNRFVPLGLIILFPINVNIFLFHLVLDPSGMIMGTVLLAINCFLLFAYREHFLHLAKAEALHSHH
jgi:putative oxidoreductase